jgi:hypothetical protein
MARAHLAKELYATLAYPPFNPYFALLHSGGIAAAASEREERLNRL